MSRDAIVVILIASSIPGIIIVAVVVKLWEMHKASKWPQTTGKVIRSAVKSKKYEPGEIGHNFGDSDVTNEPDVQYEFTVSGEKFIGHRVTIGEKTADFELDGILQKYPVGAEVTVYYDPANPKTAVLERDLDKRILFLGVGCLLAFFIGGPLLVAGTYFASEHWLKHHMANPARAHSRPRPAYSACSWRSSHLRFNGEHRKQAAGRLHAAKLSHRTRRRFSLCRRATTNAGASTTNPACNTATK